MSSNIEKGSIKRIRAQLREKKKKDQEQKKSNTYHNDKYAKYYGLKAWRELRNYYINNHPLCENHLKYDLLVEAKEVHHKKIWSFAETEEKRYKLLLDEKNLMSLCSACHHDMHIKARERSLTYVDDVMPRELIEY